MKINGIAMRTIRERSGLTLRNLADHTGLSFSYLRELEVGRRLSPSDRVVKLIASALRVPITAITTGGEE